MRYYIFRLVNTQKFHTCSFFILHITSRINTTTIIPIIKDIVVLFITFVFLLQVISLLLPALVGDDSDIILEVSAGVGGQEAMLFTKEVFHMYLNYASYKGWSVNVVNYDETDVGRFLYLYFIITHTLIKI